MTTQCELREAIDFIKDQSGTGSKERKQEKFVDVYTESVAYLLSGERYDDAGVGPATARGAVNEVFPDLSIDDYPTISEALAAEAEPDVEDPCNQLVTLVEDLDRLAERSGNAQQSRLETLFHVHAEPSLITIALLDDETIGLGTSQMREAFFDGTRDERKHAEAFTNSTAEFVQLAQVDALPDGPTVGEPFDPMLAVPESRGEPDNSVAQTKVDGYRVLLHIKDGEATAYSRAKNDVTESLPELNEIDWPDGDYIFDGEVIAETGSYSDTSERIGRSAENVERDVAMNFKLFDILVNDGVEVWDSNFDVRHLNLLTVCLQISDDSVQYLDKTEDIERAKDEALENGDEGIIVKDMASPYEFGKRSAYWQKQKYDAETVDVVITGFNEGDGEKSGTLGAVEIESVDGVSLGNSGSGFSDEERDLIWNNQEAWLGEVIEVEARGLGTGNNLRMPIYKRHRIEGEADPMSRITELMDDV